MGIPSIANVEQSIEAIAGNQCLKNGAHHCLLRPYFIARLYISSLTRLNTSNLLQKY